MKISWYVVLSFLQREFQFSTLEWMMVFILFLAGMILLFCMKNQEGYDMDRIIWFGTLSFYLAMVMGVTFLNREPMAQYQWNMQLFWSYEAVQKGSTASLLQILSNIAMFIPWGFLLPYIWKSMRTFSHLLLASVLFTLCIEVMQFITKRGLFELDDLLHNTIGGIVGYLIYVGWNIMKKRWKDMYINLDKKNNCL